MKRAFLSGVFAFVLLAVSPAAEKSFSPVDYVNPFIGTTNFGTTNPGAVCPNDDVCCSFQRDGVGGQQIR